MPLLGLLDWIVIATLLLAVGFGFTCYLLMLLNDWFSFKPKTYYRNSTIYKNEDGERCLIEAPRNYLDSSIKRSNDLKWYHQLIVGP